jgi:dTMP kinase
VLIVLEGAEAVGKTTQLARITEWFTASGIDHICVREPGGTPVGDELRRVLLDPSSSLSPRAEALLFMASRAELVDRVIRPALAARRAALVDRFFLSTYAYQVHGRGLEEADVRAANRLATGGLVPDLTVLLTLPLTTSRERLQARQSGPDRMEQAADGFHERVAAAFATFARPEWQASHPECGRVIPIDAGGSEARVFDRIKQVITDGWPGSFPVLTR